MTEHIDIAGYCRISVDEELDRDNVSIENQKAIITDFVKHRFPDSTLTFYEDRDRSGYTFEQREGYQAMRRGLMDHRYDVLIVKDFSRFSRRNSRYCIDILHYIPQSSISILLVTTAQYCAYFSKQLYSDIVISEKKKHNLFQTNM